MNRDVKPVSFSVEQPDELLEASTKFWLTEQLRAVLKDLRHERELTQSEVARKLGRDQVFVSNCESGRRRIDPIELLAFAAVYGVSLEELVEPLDLAEARERDYHPGG